MCQRYGVDKTIHFEVSGLRRNNVRIKYWIRVHVLPLMGVNLDFLIPKSYYAGSSHNAR